MRCCKNCVLRENFRGKVGCILNDKHFKKQALGKPTDCPNWQEIKNVAETRRVIGEVNDGIY